MMNYITMVPLVHEALRASQEEAIPGRINLATSTRQTLRGFALKKIVKHKRKVGRLLVTQSTCHNLITYWT
jgi:hypothetical protein